PIGVAGQPVRHVTAEGGAEAGGPGVVDFRPRAYDIKQTLHIGPDRGGAMRPGPGKPGRTVTSGKRRVRKQHRPAASHRTPRAPTPTPRVVRRERSAMNPQLQRCAYGGVGRSK